MKLLKLITTLATILLIALIAGPVGFLLGTNAKRGLGFIPCRGGNGFEITIRVPDQWICEPDDYGLTLRSQLFEVEISILARLPACSGPDSECIVSEFYADNNIILKLKTINNKDVEIFGDYNSSPRISITYKDMKTRKLTEQEKSELIKVLKSVKFEKKPFGF